MKSIWIITGLILFSAILISGCTSDPTGVLYESGEVEISGELVPAESSGDSGWVLWREEEVDLVKGGYSMNRPNLDQVYFSDLKVEVDTDAPVDVRFVTLQQCDDYQGAWDDYYMRKTADSFDPDAIGYVDFFSGISDASVESRGNEDIVIIIEPHDDMPAKGTVKMYYMG